MTETPQVQPLPYKQRRFVFVSALVIFCITVPLLVFYAVGYRFDLDAEDGNIIGVGGMYISTDADNTSLYLNDEPVENMRIFQRAAYLANLPEGSHKIHVQGEGLDTWVKELPVYSHFVTEARSFNMPTVPEVRLIQQYLTTQGQAIMQTATSTDTPIVGHMVRNDFIFSTSTATSTFIENTEYGYVHSLFESASSTQSVLDIIAGNLQGRFQFSDASLVEATTTATTTVVYNDMRLSQIGDDIFASWVGGEDRIPYFYCVKYSGTSTRSLYGTHVWDSIAAVYASEDAQFETELSEGEQLCRDSILIERHEQQVLWFNFYPNETHLVLMLLDDGLYVTEIDDRTWQNTQLLYAGTDLRVVLDGDRIYVEDGTYFMEVFTEIAS